MELEIIIPNEETPTQKDNYGVYSFVWEGLLLSH